MKRRVVWTDPIRRHLNKRYFAACPLCFLAPTTGQRTKLMPGSDGKADSLVMNCYQRVLD